MEFAEDNHKPRGPFKFNLVWALEEDFKHIILSNWKSFDSYLNTSTTSQVIQNLQTIKMLVIDWTTKRLAYRGKRIKDKGIVQDQSLLSEVKQLEEIKAKSFWMRK